MNKIIIAFVAFALIAIGVLFAVRSFVSPFGLPAAEVAKVEKAVKKAVKKPQARKGKRAEAPAPALERKCFFFGLRCVLVDVATGLVVEEPRYLPDTQG